MENLSIQKFTDTIYETSLAGLIYLIEHDYLVNNAVVIAIIEDEYNHEMMFDTLLIELGDDTYTIYITDEEDEDEAILMMSDVSFTTFFHIHTDYVIGLEEEFDMQSELYTLNECVSLDSIMLEMKDIMNN